MGSVQEWHISEPYLKLSCRTGEAPFYDKARGKLRFVDIPEKRYFEVDLQQGPLSLQTFDLEEIVSVTADVEGDSKHLVVGSKDGFSWLDKEKKKLIKINTVWTAEEMSKKGKIMRFNDGAVDPQGRFWAGTMNDESVPEPRPEGVLFRLDPDLSLHRMIEGITVSNGLAWTSDHRHMYFVDSPTHCLHRYDFDPATGSISNKTVIYRFEGKGFGDGLCLDIEDCIWVAVYMGSAVLRISPEGKLLGRISLPTKAITCPAFVGTELFITSAQTPSEQARDDPQAAELGGSVFRIDVGIRGQPPTSFKGSP